MNNGRTSSGTERKEPQLSQMTNLDRIRDEAGTNTTAPERSADSTQRGSARTGSQSSRSQSSRSQSSSRNQPPEKQSSGNGGVWFFVVLLTCGLVGVSGYGYLELQRVSGMQRTMLERVNVLATTSDQFSTKLNASGGQLQQTQSSVNARVTQLETKVLGQLGLVQETAKQGKSLGAELKAQLATSIEKQSKAFATTSSALKADLEASFEKSLASVKTLDQSQSKALASLKQTFTTLEKDLALVSADIKRETTGFNQSLQLLKEELAIDPERLKILQDQFTTYMQSVDQFRQQTNGSLNELSLQIQDVYRSQEVNEVQELSTEPAGFGVQPLRQE